MKNEFSKTTFSLPEGVHSEPMEGYCDRHGKFIDIGTFMGARLIGSPICPECLRLEEEQKAKDFALECKRQELQSAAKRYEAVLDKSAIPPRYRNRTFENFETLGDRHKQGIVNRLKAYVANFGELRKGGNGFIISGTVGTGKTHLACAVLQALANVAPGVYTTAHDMGQKVADSWGVKERGKTTADVKSVFFNCPLLVIDEVGKPNERPITAEVLSEVIFARYDALKPTIFVTNVAPDNLHSIFEKPELDRIRETCKGLYLDWASYRENKELF